MMFAASAYLTFPVMVTEPNRIGEVEQGERQGGRRMDGRTGLVLTDAPALTVTRRAYTFLADTAVKVADIFGAMDTLKGSLKPFWMPSWQADYVIGGGTQSVDGSSIAVNANLLTGTPTTARRYLCVREPNGTLYLRSFYIEEAESGGATLMLSSPIGTQVTTAWLCMMLRLVRLESDVAEVTWLVPGEVAEWEMAVVEVPREVPTP